MGKNRKICCEGRRGQEAKKSHYYLAVFTLSHHLSVKTL